MPRRDIVVIGASAGGLEVLQELTSGLSPELDAAILVVLHTSKHADGILPQIFNRYGKFPALHPEDGSRIRKGRMYIAPPDYHMIVEDGRLRIVQGPRENRHRPAIDPLFRSAGTVYGPRVIGVILSGLLDDGTAGLMVVHAAGGKAIVQEPRTALFPSMPTSALRQVPEALAVPPREIADLLLKLSREEVLETAPRRSAILAEQKEIKLAEADMPEIENDGRRGKPSQFACPDCGGVLWEIEDAGFLRFRCRVGHAFTAAHLDAEQHRAVEAALWAALRALEERASLYRNMAERVRSAPLGALPEEYETSATEKEAQASTLRDFLLDINSENRSLRPFTRSA